MNEIYLSAKDVANHIDSTVRTIQNWAAAGNIGQNEQGKYGLISAYKYQLEKISLDLGRVRLQLSETKEELSASKKDLDEEAYEARKRKAIAEATKEEALAGIKHLELQEKKGKLVDADDVEQTWVNLISTCVSKFQTVPAKLAMQLSGMDSPAEIQQLLVENINENLSELGDISKIQLEESDLNHTE